MMYPKPATQPAGSEPMIIGILALAIVSGWIVSRPIVRALGLA